MQANQKRVIALAAAHRLPAIYTFRDYVDAGGLVSYGVSLPDLFRRAAVSVDNILKGARPSELPVEQATGSELVVNVGAAKALGLALPATFLSRADAVIE
jgi:putative ABC transport system substrate-binding protein